MKDTSHQEVPTYRPGMGLHLIRRPYLARPTVRPVNSVVRARETAVAHGLVAVQRRQQELSALQLFLFPRAAHSQQV